MKHYIVIQTYSSAVDLDVEAESEDEALEKAEQLIAGGAIPDEQIMSGLEPEELYVQQKIKEE